MAIIRNGKVYRNIQEQVLKNTEDIEEIKSDIGYIELSESSGTLTEYQYNECLKKYVIICSISSNQKNYYFKINESISESGNSFLFKKIATTNSSYDNSVYFVDSYINIQANKNYSRTTDDFSLQKELISGENIKTINGISLLGSGNISLTHDIKGVGSITLSLGPGYGTLTTDEFNEINNNDISIIIIGNTIHYKTTSSPDLLIFQSASWIDTSNQNYNVYRTFVINVDTSNKNWQRTLTGTNIPKYVSE